MMAKGRRIRAGAQQTMERTRLVWNGVTYGSLHGQLVLGEAHGLLETRGCLARGSRQADTRFLDAGLFHEEGQDTRHSARLTRARPPGNHTHMLERCHGRRDFLPIAIRSTPWWKQAGETVVQSPYVDIGGSMRYPA